MTDIRFVLLFLVFAITGWPQAWQTVRSFRGTGAPAATMCNTGADLGITYTDRNPNGATYACRLNGAGAFTWYTLSTAAGAFQPLNANLTAYAATANATTATAAVSALTAITSTTAVALAVNPAACALNNWVMDIAANGTLTCTQPASTNLSDSAGIVRGGAALTTHNKVVTVDPTTDGAIAEIPNQTANYAFMGPVNGAAAAPAFRALVSADIPNNAADTSGKATTSGTADALSTYLTEAREPAHDGDVANLAGDLTLTVASYIPKCKTVTVNGGNAAFTAASLTATVALETLPAKAIVTGMDIKHSVIYSDGAGAMTEVGVTVGSPAGGATFFSANQNIGEATAVADTTLLSTSLFKRATAASEALNAYFTATGRNFGDGAGATFLATGSVDIGYCYFVKP